MEKQTKILIGVGAVIAAYLILKPKKAVAQMDVVSKLPNPTILSGEQPGGNNPCQCAKAPCNCDDGGVKLDVLIPPPTYIGSSNMGLRLQEIERELKLVQIPQVI
jgi:hypothetical protein